MDEKVKNEHSSDRGTYELAGFLTRALAVFIDAFFLVMILMILGLIAAAVGGGERAQAYQSFGLIVPVAYSWYFWTRRDGRTPGKFALGIRVVKADGTAISDTDAVIRAIGYQVSALLCGLGYIWAIFDKNNQTWHDKLAGTYVVRVQDKRDMVDVG